MPRMKLRDIATSFKGLFGRSSKQAAALPLIADPKVPNKAQAQPSYSKRTKTTSGDQRLTATDEYPEEGSTTLIEFPAVQQ